MKLGDGFSHDTGSDVVKCQCQCRSLYALKQKFSEENAQQEQYTRHVESSCTEEEIFTLVKIHLI